MVRARLWLTCAAVHDPVSPVLVEPARIGWQAKFRQVDLTIERGFNGPELLSRMKGWVTVEVGKVEDILAARGRLKILDDRELVVEFEQEADFEAAEADLGDEFADQVSLERLN